jgi:hypothetical protein
MPWLTRSWWSSCVAPVKRTRLWDRDWFRACFRTVTVASCARSRRCLFDAAFETSYGARWLAYCIAWWYIYTQPRMRWVGRNGTTSEGRLGAARFISTCASQVWNKAVSCGGEPLEHRESTCDSRGTSMMALLKLMVTRGNCVKSQGHI